MAVRRILAITRRILEQFRHDRRTLALLFVAPLIILSLLGYLLRGGGGAPPMGVVVEDSGPLGNVVASALQRSTTVSATTMSRRDADARLRSGEIAGYLLVPADFSSQAQQSREISLEVNLEGSQPGLSGTVLQAVAQSLTELAGQAGGGHFSIRRSYLYGGGNLDNPPHFRGPLLRLGRFFLLL